MKTHHDFYADLARKKGWAHIVPLLDLLPAIESETQSRGLNIFTSHEVLRITPHTEYSEWTHDNILSIVPDRSGVARVIFQSKEDLNLKIPIVDVFEKGGSLIPYHELIAAMIPYLEKLARKKRA